MGKEEKGVVVSGGLESLSSVALAQGASRKHLSVREQIKRVWRLIIKEFSERIAFGLLSSQFINILLMLSGASYFFIGLLNVIKDFIAVNTVSFIKKHSSETEAMYKNPAFMSVLSSLLVISTIFLGIFMFNRELLTFALFFILYTLTSTIYGGIFYEQFQDVLRAVPKYKFLNLSGIILTSAALFVAAEMLDDYRYNFLWLFLSASVLFVISGVMITSHLKPRSFFLNNIPSMVCRQARLYAGVIKRNYRLFFRDKTLFILVLTGMLSSAANLMTNTFLGIFIYKELGNVAFGGFKNVAIIFIPGLLTAFFIPFIVRSNARIYGRLPLITFGTLLSAILPFTLYYNPNIISLAMAVVLAITGYSITDVSRGLIAMDLLSKDERNTYFALISLLSTLAYAITIPPLLFAATHFGLRAMFLLIALLLVLIISPLYLLLVIITNKKGVIL